jgi:hypothetical protein
MELVSCDHYSALNFEVSPLVSDPEYLPVIDKYKFVYIKQNCLTLKSPTQHNSCSIVIYTGILSGFTRKDKLVPSPVAQPQTD